MNTSTFRNAWRKLWRRASGRSGNVTIMFALMILPMVGAIGLAVDFGTILKARTLAQVGADAAALQASGVARDLILKGGSSPAEQSSAMDEAKKTAKALFGAYAQTNGLKDYSLTLEVKREGNDIKASAAYSVSSKTYIAQIFGQTSYSAKGQSMSQSSLPNYVDVYLAVDNSQSMGIGATGGDMDNLYKLRGCVFGCHVALSGQPSSNEQAAKAAGIRLRIDIIRDEIVKMIETAQTDAGGSAVYRFGMYLMGADPNSPKSPLTTELSPISGNYTTLITKAKTITLGWNNTSGVGDSHINDQITSLTSKIPKSGNGVAQATARSYFFLMTDGLRDVYGASCTSGHCTAAIDPTSCQTLKNNSVTVGVLYTTYLPIYNSPMNKSSGFQGDYKSLVVNKGLDPLISQKLQQCASSNWFFEASDAVGINIAMTKMFGKIALESSLTQ